MRPIDTQSLGEEQRKAERIKSIDQEIIRHKEIIKNLTRKEKKSLQS